MHRRIALRPRPSGAAIRGTWRPVRLGPGLQVCADCSELRCFNAQAEQLLEAESINFGKLAFLATNDASANQKATPEQIGIAASGLRIPVLIGQSRLSPKMTDCVANSPDFVQIIAFSLTKLLIVSRNAVPRG